MADMLTWQSRRVRLVPKGNEVTGALLTNGNRLDPVNLWRSETMTCWRENENQEKRLGIKPVYTPIRHDPSRSFWRGLASVLVPGKGKNDGNVKTAGVVEWVALLTDADYDASIDEDEMISVHATGISYGTQNAVISEMIDDDVRISTFLLSEMGKGARMVVDSCLEATAEAVSLLGLLARRIELAAGADSVPAAAA
jgi:CRISPR system Cascade subunit CasA